jgi:hypothetical protein
MPQNNSDQVASATSNHDQRDYDGGHVQDVQMGCVKTIIKSIAKTLMKEDTGVVALRFYNSDNSAFVNENRSVIRGQVTVVNTEVRSCDENIGAAAGRQLYQHASTSGSKRAAVEQTGRSDGNSTNSAAQFDVVTNLCNLTGTRYVCEDLKVHSQDEDQTREVDANHESHTALICHIADARKSLNERFLKSPQCVTFATNDGWRKNRVLKNGVITQKAAEILFLKNFGKFIC